MPIWGLWMNETFYFSTGRKSRKARNLAVDPRCAIGVEQARESVIVEGPVKEVYDAPLLQAFQNAYQRKYKWDMEGSEEPVYAVRPRVAFGFREKDFAESATRWRFPES